MVVREITVVKRPRNDKVEDRPISFPPLQNLHLNLMENKKKLKKNLPIIQIKKQPPKPDELNVKPYTPDMMAGKAPVSVIKRSVGSSKSDTSKGEKSKAGDTPKSKDRVEKGDGKSKEGKSKNSKSKGDDDPETSKEGRSKKKVKERSKDVKKDSEKKRSKKRSKEEGNIQEEEEGDVEEEEGIQEEEVHEDEDEKVDAASASEEDVDEIAEDLGDNPKEEGGVQEDDPASSPPGPSDEPASGADEEDDDPYAGLSPEERERQEREEYIWRFKIMKKKYRNRNIPEFNEHDDLDMMKMTYQRSLKEISLDENVESYRMYLRFGFMGMEYVATQWLGIDLTGFAKQQMNSMEKYDSLLIELGEKSQSRWLSNLPVEIRLIGFIIIQAGMFYVGKIIAGNVGEGIADLFKAFTGQNNGASGTPGAASAAGAADVPKKKMRGPSIKADDIKKMKEQDV